MPALPQSFSDLEPFVADWALPTRAQRYEARLSKPFEELVRFYDAVAPRAEEAIGRLNGLDIDDLPGAHLVLRATDLAVDPHSPFGDPALHRRA